MLQVFKSKEVMDNSITLTKTAMSGAVIDTDRLVIGTEEGLLCIDLDREGKHPSYPTPILQLFNRISLW